MPTSCHPSAAQPNPTSLVACLGRGGGGGPIGTTPPFERAGVPYRVELFPFFGFFTCQFLFHFILVWRGKKKKKKKKRRGLSLTTIVTYPTSHILFPEKSICSLANPSTSGDKPWHHRASRFQNFVFFCSHFHLLTGRQPTILGDQLPGADSSKVSTFLCLRIC